MKTEINIDWAIVFLIIPFLMGGCATAPVKPLLHHLTGFDHIELVQSMIPDEEVTKYYKPASNLGAGSIVGTGGLVGLGIGILVNKAGSALQDQMNKTNRESAEDLITPLRESTSDIDFRNLYWNELENALSASTWLKINKFKKISSWEEFPSKEEFSKLSTPVLKMSTDYELSEDAQILRIKTFLQLYVTNLNTADYSSFHTYYSEKIGNESDNAEKVVQLWAANNAKSYRKAIAEGITENINMFKFDILEKPADLNTESVEEDVSNSVRSYLGYSIPQKGKVLKRNNDRICFWSSRTGSLYSIPISLMK